VKQLLAAATDVDGDRSPSRRREFYQGDAQTPGVVVVEAGQPQSALMLLQGRDQGGQRIG
jgi:hypothetical protein